MKSQEILSEIITPLQYENAIPGHVRPILCIKFKRTHKNFKRNHRKSAKLLQRFQPPHQVRYMEGVVY